jgi:hypothetical protein
LREGAQNGERNWILRQAMLTKIQLFWDVKYWKTQTLKTEAETGPESSVKIKKINTL